MGRFYQKFLRAGISLAPLGVTRDPEASPCFCTPRGARLIGWAGVDGVHYCFVRGYGEMVFAVSPMNAAPDYVHPLARDFSDFLRLLLACGPADALEQAWQWSEAQFDAYLRENPPTPAQRAVQDELAHRFALAPMERPYDYLRQVRAGFDPQGLKYNEEYYDPTLNPGAPAAAPEWQVFFDGGFWGKRGRRSRPGQTLALGVRFCWAGRQWLAPAAYLCARGIVLDLCFRVEPEQAAAFVARWAAAEGEELTPAEERACEQSDPFRLTFRSTLHCNGRALPSSSGYGMRYLPGLPGPANREAAQVAAHYGLDPACGWAFWRLNYPWTTRRPKLHRLALTLTPEPEALPGPCFAPRAPGEQLLLTHPATGAQHLLTVASLGWQSLPKHPDGLPGWVRPLHFLELDYTLSPDLPGGELTLADCVRPDPTRPAQLDAGGAAFLPAASDGVCVLGGAHGPTALFVAHTGRPQLHTACSSLHFAPLAEVTWQAVFHLTPWQEERFALYEEE